MTYSFLVYIQFVYEYHRIEKKQEKFCMLSMLPLRRASSLQLLQKFVPSRSVTDRRTDERIDITIANAAHHHIARPIRTTFM